MQHSSTSLAETTSLLSGIKGKSQAHIAKEAGVSQSTVSRRSKKPPQRHSEASYKLCRYAEMQIHPDGRQKKATLKAFDEVWQKSPAHAVAISKIIEAFTELCRHEDREEHSG